jgi:hypothetical protein
MIRANESLHVAVMVVSRRADCFDAADRRVSLFVGRMQREFARFAGVDVAETTPTLAKSDATNSKSGTA